MASYIPHLDTRDTATVPTTALGTLGDFGLAPGCENGIVVDALEPGARLVVRTKNSCYRFEMEGGRRARVVGGRFDEPTEIRIEGATAGGSVIKAGWIGVGLRLELAVGKKRVTTSTVQLLSIEQPEATAKVA